MVNIIFGGFRFRISGNRISTLWGLYDRTIPTLIPYFAYVTTHKIDMGELVGTLVGASEVEYNASKIQCGQNSKTL